MALSVTGPHDGDFRWTAVVDEDHDHDSLAADLDRLDDRVDTLGPVQLWIRHVQPGDDELAAAHGLRPYRDLWQLRCPLPRPRSDLPTRAFRPDDLDELVAVNNRAFAWHPEQGGRRREDIERIMAESWFDPDGLRLLHLDGRLAGFCWTKIHADHEPPLGEIYVIGIDPDFHGRGLGVGLTLAGLDWLADRGLRHAMLYVESDNAPANATYRRIGFTHHHTDRAYRRDAPEQVAS